MSPRARLAIPGALIVLSDFLAWADTPTRRLIGLGVVAANTNTDLVHQLYHANSFQAFALPAGQRLICL